MRGAQILRHGEPPVLGDVRLPARSAGQALIEIRAAPINPVDLAVASGRFYAGPPELPYVPGREGVGVVLEGDALAAGTRVHFLCDAGYGAGGSMAERALVSEATAITLSGDGVPDAVAASLGVAGLAGWLALEWRARLAPGEHALILGATGAVGRMAVQAALLLGAGRVVAAGRAPEALVRALELGAHATVALAPGESAEALAERIGHACGGRLDVVLDPLWGTAVEAAALAASPGARIVNIGASAGNQASIQSSVIRGKLLSVAGLTVFAVPREPLSAAYRTMLAHAAAGRLVVDHEVIPLTRVAEAWQRQAGSPHTKLVIDPRLS